MAESIQVQASPVAPAKVDKVAEAKAAAEAKNKALAGKFMDPQYDWVEALVHKTWLPIATSGKVVGSVLESIAGDAPVEHMVNIVRRAVHAHENRPVVDWAPNTAYLALARVKGPEGKVYCVDAPGTSGTQFAETAVGSTLVLKLEDPQPAAAAKPASPPMPPADESGTAE
ncbi:MAG: hypothetical protein ACYDCQ_17910 [Dehalococcoidia bacterium]